MFFMLPLVGKTGMMLRESLSFVASTRISDDGAEIAAKHPASVYQRSAVAPIDAEPVIDDSDWDNAEVIK